jgi:CubicO group peptidase (beta-lactamase class C family)
VVHDENAWFWSGDGASGHAGLFGSAAGVLAVGRALVDVMHGRLISFLTRDELWPLVRPRPPGTLRAGFDGKSAEGSSSGTLFGPSTIGHLGFTGTSLWCDIDREMVGVLLTNRVHPSRDNDVIRKVRPFAYDRIGEWAQRRRDGQGR